MQRKVQNCGKVHVPIVRGAFMQLIMSSIFRSTGPDSMEEIRAEYLRLRNHEKAAEVAASKS